GVRGLEQGELLVLAGEVHDREPLLPETAQDLDPLGHARGIPARYVDAAPRPVDAIGVRVEHDALEVAPEAAREGRLRLRVLGEKLPGAREVGAHGLARLERREARGLPSRR